MTKNLHITHDHPKQGLGMPAGAVFRTWIDFQGRLDPKHGLSNPNPLQAKQSVKRDF